MPYAEASSSSSAPSMALLQLSDFDQHEEFLQQWLSESPDIIVTQLKAKLIASHAVSCLDHTMQTWLERARSSKPKRGIKRGSSDLPTLKDLEEYGDYLRGLLAEDPSLGRRKLREAMKEKGSLVSLRTMSNWLDHYHGKSKRTLLAAPIEDLPCLDLEGLRAYESELLSKWNDNLDITYTQLTEFLEQEHGRTCSKHTMQH